MNIFMAFAFRDEDKSLVNYIERLLASQFIQINTGGNLGGGQLTLEVQNRIENSDALIALLTRRDQLQAGGWTTHQWVKDELGFARTKGKRAIAIVEEDVDVGGMYHPHEFIPLNRASLLETFLRLSETVGGWKQETGRRVKVQINPETIANKLGDGGVVCRSRLGLHGNFTVWQAAIPSPEIGGTFVYLNGVQDEHLVQIEVQEAGNTWQSIATSQWMQVQLKRKGAGV